MKAVRDIYDKSKGGKTALATVIWLAMQTVNGLYPNTIPDNVQIAVYNVAEILAVIGLTDKVYRNRQKIIDYIKNKFTPKIKKNG